MGSESTSVVKRTIMSPTKRVLNFASQQHTKLNPWVLFWFYATAIICTWDATFIMLRPYTLPGGSLAWFWYLYKYYVVVDQRYQDTDDAFVFAQSLLNYAEVIFNVVTITMHYKRSAHTTITAFMVSVMTMWKTVLYFLMFSDFCTGGMYRQGNTVFQEVFLVVIPNIIWVIAPLAAMGDLWPKMLQSCAQEWKEAQVIENDEEYIKVNGITNDHAVLCGERNDLHCRKNRAQNAPFVEHFVKERTVN